MSEKLSQTTGADILDPNTLKPTGRTVGERSTAWENLADSEQDKSLSETELANYQIDLYADRIQTINDEIKEKMSLGDDISDLEAEISRIEYIVGEVTNARDSLTLPRNSDKTISDILKEKSDNKREQISNWQETGKFPNGWERTRNQLDLLDIAVETVDYNRNNLKSQE